LPNEDNNEPGRRSFFSALAALCLAAAGGVGVFVAGGFLYPVRREKPRPLFVALESKVPAESPLYITDPAGRNVLLLRTEEGLVAIGTVCSHLGCTVFYRPEKKIFECPCHQGVFDSLGNPVSGPPQRPLRRYPAIVKSGKVFVEFTLGGLP